MNATIIAKPDLATEADVELLRLVPTRYRQLADALDRRLGRVLAGDERVGDGGSQRIQAFAVQRADEDTRRADAHLAFDRVDQHELHLDYADQRRRPQLVCNGRGSRHYVDGGNGRAVDLHLP